MLRIGEATLIATKINVIVAAVELAGSLREQGGFSNQGKVVAT